jgi:hypothetical protein
MAKILTRNGKRGNALNSCVVWRRNSYNELTMAFGLRMNFACACLAALISVPPAPAFRTDTEEDLLSHIQREHDPVRRAKLEIRLARLKLQRGAEACVKDDLDACSQLLNAYLEFMKRSWKDMQSSGRNAVKQPSGFKELDIALREDAWSLDDYYRKIPYEDRDAVTPVIQQVGKLHDEVFAALFPSGAPRPAENKPLTPAASHFATRSVQ